MSANLRYALPKPPKEKPPPPPKYAAPPVPVNYARNRLENNLSHLQEIQQQLVVLVQNYYDDELMCCRLLSLKDRIDESIELCNDFLHPDNEHTNQFCPDTIHSIVSADVNEIRGLLSSNEFNRSDSNTEQTINTRGDEIEISSRAPGSDTPEIKLNEEGTVKKERKITIGRGRESMSNLLVEEFKNEPEETFYQRLSSEIEIKEFEELFNDTEEEFITNNRAGEGNSEDGENDKHLVVHDDEEVEIKHHERELKISIAAAKIKRRRATSSPWKSFQSPTRDSGKRESFLKSPVTRRISTLVVPAREETCPICWESKMVYTLECSHFYCVSCLSVALETKIKNGEVLRIPCFNPMCLTDISRDDIQKCVSESVFAKYNQFIYLTNLRENPNIRYCPVSNCSTLITNASSFDSIVVCPTCSFEFCFSCGRQWHPELSCSENEEILKLEQTDDAMLLQWIEEHKTKPCPQCKVHIEKNGGCNHVIISFLLRFYLLF